MTEADASDGRDECRLVKHSVVVAGHRTSISLENLFWYALKEQAADRGLSVANLIRAVDETREGVNLSSALRVYVLRTALNRVGARNTGAVERAASSIDADVG